jgi:tripartite-type tricarboxylate transporter receptor subunit TctC
LVKTEEWKRELESNDLQDTFAGALEAKRMLETEYGVYRTVLMELGLTKSDSAR